MVTRTKSAVAEVPAPGTIQLASGRLRASVAPEIGGAVASLAFEKAPGIWFDILRPASARALAARNPREMACFPMVPFASLVHQGRFSFAGKHYQLRHNLPGHDAALHGDGWQHPWQVGACTSRSLILDYRQHGDRFPFLYEARQQVRLEHDALVLTLSVTNTGKEAMPAGLGFHPFFPLTPDAALRFDALGAWARDGSGRVTHVQPLSSATSFAAPVRLSGRPRNDVYEGWTRKACISWEASGVSVDLHAHLPLARLLVFVPEKRSVFCVEPICNLPDGFNLLGAGGADPGIAVLRSQQTLTVEMRLECRPL